MPGVVVQRVDAVGVVAVSVAVAAVVVEDGDDGGWTMDGEDTGRAVRWRSSVLEAG